jgi:L-lactate dehydrogenase
MRKQNKKPGSVAIIGCGHVGPTSAYSLLISGTVRELILIDRDGEKLIGDVMNLQNAVILPVSVLTDGQYGISGVYLSLPCVIGRRGIERIVELPLCEPEKRALLESAEVLRLTREKLRPEKRDSAANAG